MLPNGKRLAGFLTGILLLLAVVGFTNGAQAFSLINTQQEIDMGREYAQKLEKQYGLVNDFAMQQRVADIGARIAAVSDRKEVAYTYKVLNSNEVNALALPGGYIYVFKGLIDYMPSDDELAGILGHETGHVAKRHTVIQMEKSMGIGILAALLSKGRDSDVLISLAYNAVMQGYSRADEREADRLGFQYSMRAGYNPYSMLMGLQKLADLDEKRRPNYGLFSSHPEPEDRMRLIEGQLSDHAIRPKIATDSGRARVVDDGLNLPSLTATYHDYRPVYRAAFAAGKLSLVSRAPGFSGDWFFFQEHDSMVTIYYEDQDIITLTAQDAAGSGMSIDTMAEVWVRELKTWANTRKK